jgi:hypothetical protein
MGKGGRAGQGVVGISRWSAHRSTPQGQPTDLTCSAFPAHPADRQALAMDWRKAFQGGEDAAQVRLFISAWKVTLQQLTPRLARPVSLSPFSFSSALREIEQEIDARTRGVER